MLVKKLEFIKRVLKMIETDLEKELPDEQSLSDYWVDLAKYLRWKFGRKK